MTLCKTTFYYLINAVKYFCAAPYSKHLKAFQRTPNVPLVSPYLIHIMAIEKLNRGRSREKRKTRVVLGKCCRVVVL
jgi:hypothetical protein